MNSKKTIDLILYLLLIGPPRGSRISREAAQRKKPIKINNAIVADYFFEYLTRLGVLVVIFYGVTESMTKFYFDYYNIIYIVFSLIIFGSLHTLAYFLHTELYNSRHVHIYSIIKIVIYSVLPAFLPVAALIVYREVNQITAFGDMLPVYCYAATFSLLTVIGIANYAVRSMKKSIN